MKNYNLENRTADCYAMGIDTRREPLAAPKIPKKFRWGVSILLLVAAVLCMSAFALYSSRGDYNFISASFDSMPKGFLKELGYAPNSTVKRIDTYEELEMLRNKGFTQFNLDTNKYGRAFFKKNSIIIIGVVFSMPRVVTFDYSLRTESGPEIYLREVDVREEGMAYLAVDQRVYYLFEIPDEELEGDKSIKVFYP